MAHPLDIDLAKARREMAQMYRKVRRENGGPNARRFWRMTQKATKSLKDQAKADLMKGWM